MIQNPPTDGIELAKLTWIQVEDYLKKSKSIIIPIGSTEQHGPTGLIGTDFMAAQAVALGVGKELGCLVAPPVCYGMANHHLAFAGSASARPSVYQAYLAEILRSFYHHGFRAFHVINGHGGNQASVEAVFQELKAENLADASFRLFNWWRGQEVAELAKQLYGDLEGMHATPSEVSLTFHLEGIESRPYDYVERNKGDIPWPLSAVEVRRFFPDGTMRSNPGLARGEHGARFLKVAVTGISESIRKAATLAK